jgi:hypothetical protein
MIKIEIESGDTKDLFELTGVSSKTNKPYHIRRQTAYAFTVGPDGKPSKYPKQIGLYLEKDQAPYPAGLYTLHPSSLDVRDEGLSLRPSLVPVKASAAAA